MHRLPTNRSAVVALALGVAMLAGASPVLAAPARLQLTLDKSTLRVGETTRVAVQFFDRANTAVPNDRERVISLLAEKEVGTGAKGAGDVAPRQVTVAAGAACRDISFTARKAGRLIIQATSDGLAPGEDMVTIVEPTASSLWDYFIPTAHAQGNGSLRIVPRAPEVVANGVSPVMLYITLDRVLARGEKVHVWVTTSPSVSILHKDRSERFVDLEIDEANGQSNRIGIQSPRAGVVTVSARVPGTGLKDDIRVRFLAPEPARIVFDPAHETIPTYQRRLPVAVQLADKDGVPITATPPGPVTGVDKTHRIEIASATDPDAVTVAPQPVFELSATRPSHQVVLTLRTLPSGGQLRLLASDKEGDLTPGKATVALESLIRRVTVAGPATVHSGRQGYPLTLQLVDEAGKSQAADWDRRISLIARDGKVDRDSVTIPQGQDKATVLYSAAGVLGTDTIRADSVGLDPGSCTTNVVTAASLLVFFAGLGGVLGGLARHVYRVRSPILWPHRRHGHLEPGLVGNAAFSILFGVVHFQAAELGFHTFEWTGSFENGTCAFFLGVLGGFSGVLVLERLVKTGLGRARPEAAPPHVASRA
jgi:hypothetical protein